MRMAHELMTRCERRTRYKNNGSYEWRWKDIPELLLGAAIRDKEIQLVLLAAEVPVRTLRR